MPASRRKTVKAARTLPPVLVRTEAAGGASEKYKRNKARRRYDVALGVPGAELRLPSLPNFRVGWRLLSGLLAILLGATIYYAWTAPMFQVEAVSIKGLQRLTELEVNTVIGLHQEPIFTIDPESIRLDLQEAFPEMSAITVTIGLPAVVQVSVEERQPVLAWRQEGQEVWVDVQGVSFPPRGEAGELVVVEAAGTTISMPDPDQEATPFLKPEVVSSLLAVAAQAPQGSPLVYDGDHGLGWVDERGWQVSLGMDIKDVEMKLRVYEGLVENLSQQGIQPALISVEFVHAPYYRLER